MLNELKKTPSWQDQLNELDTLINMIGNQPQQPELEEDRIFFEVVWED